MLHVPQGERELLKFANDTIEKCRVSVGQRAAYCRLMNAITETGRYDGMKSLINMMHSHLARAATHLFSPVELKFSLDYDRVYPMKFYQMGSVIAKQLTRQWQRTSTDKMFARGVFDSLKYGASILKQWAQVEGPKQKPAFYAKLVMPWQFGVYNESENDLDRQAALCETSIVTLAEVWRRICHLPDAKKLYERIRSHAMTGQSMSDPQSYFHQVLSTSTLQTGVNGATRPLPGGIVQLNNDPNFSIMGPTVAAETVQVHELWVQDDEDYTTIILIEPDILIAPLYKKANLLGVEGRHPFTLIQPNEVSNWLWGRSELVDLIEPQALLSTLCDDAKRLTGLQVDKLLAFSGDNTITDEAYGQFRVAGYLNLNNGAKVEDLTPKFPVELIEMIKFTIQEINTLGSFPEILQGKGEEGVRAGAHADTLLRTAAPTLRDRALACERQCVRAADLTLALKQAKDPTKYWIKADQLADVEETSFMLTDIPEDWCVAVDSHSSSPIFADENTQQVAFALKVGIVDGEYAIDNLTLPNKEGAKISLREKQKREAEQFQSLMQANPEIGQKVMEKKMSGGR